MYIAILPMTALQLCTASRSLAWMSTGKVWQSLSSLIAAAGEDNTDFSLWTEDQQTAFWAAVNDGGTAFAQEIR